MSTPDKRARAIFSEAIERQPSERRAEFIANACGKDLELRAHVERLLRSHELLGSFHDAPPADVTLDQPPLERPGTRIGPYKLLQQIGEGGMGVVYLAEQTLPVQRKVALKLIKAGMDSGQVIARFEAERQALAIMDHPNIARVLDAGTTESGRPYFVMELVNGIPVTQFCDEQHLTTRERLELFVPICQAVQHAHQKGIIHRDIKPSNILVALYDGRPVPKVIDFGVAKATSARLTEKTMFTGLGQMVGTLEYMSPEQAQRNQLDIDTRSDIYSLGVVLYELLTGDTPFDKRRLQSAALDELLRIIREEEPPKPSTKLSSSDALPSVAANRKIEPAHLSALVRGELDWIVMKALEKDRSHRYETAISFADDVLRYLNNELVQACPPSAWYQLQKMAQRNRVALAIAGLVLLFLVLLGSGIGWAVRDRSAREAEAAQQQAARQGKVAGQVESIFGEVDRLEKDQKWPEALAAARRAEAAVAGGEADAATAERVRQSLKDLAFIDRLEQIRMEDNQGNFAKQDQNYAQAFRDYGVDIDAPAIETSIERLKARPVLALPFAVALDEWVSIRRLFSKGEDAGSKRLVAIAHGIDPEPLRDRLRSAPWPSTPETQEELRRLADSIKVREHHPATLYRLAIALRGDHALRLLRDAQAAYSGDYWLNEQLGRALYEARYKTKFNLEGAIRFYTVALAVRPSAAMHHDWYLAQTLHEHGDLDQAVAICRRAIESNPKYRNAPYHRLGLVLRAQGKPDEAIAVYRQAIEARPAESGGYLDKIAETMREPKAVEANPKDFDECMALAAALVQQNKLDEAVTAYGKAAELAPNPNHAAGVYFELGSVLSRRHKRPDAIAAYLRAVELDQKKHGAAAYIGLGLLLRDWGKPDEAAASFRKAIEINDPGNNTVVAHRLLGEILMRQNKLDEAITAFNKVIELKPNSPLSLRDLAWILANRPEANLRDPKQAVEFAKQAVQLDQKNGFFWQTLGYAEYRAGNWKSAITALEQVKELGSPGDSLEWFPLAMAHWQLGEKEKARQWFDKAVEWMDKNQPNNEELRRFRAEAAELLEVKEKK